MSGNRGAVEKTEPVNSNRNSCYLETCLDADFANNQLKSDTVRFVKVDTSKQSPSNNGHKDKCEKQDLSSKTVDESNCVSRATSGAPNGKVVVDENVQKLSEDIQNIKNTEVRTRKKESPSKFVDKSILRNKTDTQKSKDSQKNNDRNSKAGNRDSACNGIFSGKDRHKMPVGRPGFLPGSNYVDVNDTSSARKDNKKNKPMEKPTDITKTNVQTVTTGIDLKKKLEMDNNNGQSPAIVPENPKEVKVVKEKKKNKFLSSLKMKGIMKKKDKVIKNTSDEQQEATVKSPPVMVGVNTSKANSSEELDCNEVDSGVGEDAGGVGVGEEEDYDEVFDGDCDDLVQEDDDDDVDSYDGGTYRIMMKTSYDVAVGATPLAATRNLSTGGLVEQRKSVSEPCQAPEITTISDYTIIEDPADSVFSKNRESNATNLHFPVCTAKDSDVEELSVVMKDEPRLTTVAVSVEEGKVMQKAVVLQPITKFAQSEPTMDGELSTNSVQNDQNISSLKEATIGIIKVETTGNILKETTKDDRRVSKSFESNSNKNELKSSAITGNCKVKDDSETTVLKQQFTDNLNISENISFTNNTSGNLEQLPIMKAASSEGQTEDSETKFISPSCESDSGVLVKAHENNLVQATSNSNEAQIESTICNSFNYLKNKGDLKTSLEDATSSSLTRNSFENSVQKDPADLFISHDSSCVEDNFSSAVVNGSSSTLSSVTLNSQSKIPASDSSHSSEIHTFDSSNSPFEIPTSASSTSPQSPQAITTVKDGPSNSNIDSNVQSSSNVPITSTSETNNVNNLEYGMESQSDNYLNPPDTSTNIQNLRNSLDLSLLLVPEQPVGPVTDEGASNGPKVPANTPTTDGDDSSWSDAPIQAPSQPSTSTTLTPVFEVRAVDAFSKAVARQNKQFVSAIQSLDALNDRIVEFVLDGWEGSTCTRGVPLDAPLPSPSPSSVGTSYPSIASFSSSREASFKAQEDHAKDNIRHRTLHASLELMRQLLLEAQNTFRSMVEENQQLASRIDGDLQTAQDQVTALRQDLQDTKSKISQFQCNNSTPPPTSSSSAAPRTPINHSKIPSSTPHSRLSSSSTSPKIGANSKIPINVSKSFPGVGGGDASAGSYKERSLSADGRRKSKSEENGDLNREDSDQSSGTVSSDQLRRENDRLSGRNKQLATELEMLKKASIQVQQANRKISSVSNVSNASSASSVGSKSNAPAASQDRNGAEELASEEVSSTVEGGGAVAGGGENRVTQLATELSHAKEALSALKADRKRLKTEKVDLLQQMKQLYATLEDKEAELRDFIRNFEQRMAESEDALQQLRAERDAGERERWGLLQRLGEEGERAAKLAHQLTGRDKELDMLRKQLSSLGYQCDVNDQSHHNQHHRTTINGGIPSSSSTAATTTPTATTPTTNTTPLPPTTNTTPNGRGSSADSGVRLSSDRDSTASHEGGPTTPPKDPSCIYATPHLHNNSTNTATSAAAPPNGTIHSASISLNHQTTNPYQTTSLYSTSPPNHMYSTYSSNSSSHNPYATSPQLNNPNLMNNLSAHLNSAAGHLGSGNPMMNHDANPYSSSSLYSGPREDPVLMGTPRSLGGLGSLGSSQSEGGDYSGTQSHPMGNNLYSNSNTPCSERSGSMAAGLSQSTEQLCDRVAEAAESALQQQQPHANINMSGPTGGEFIHQGPPPPGSQKPRGSTMTLSRKTQKALGGGGGGGGGGGTWGSISRVFARQKKRAALDASLYDGSGASSSEDLSATLSQP